MVTVEQIRDMPFEQKLGLLETVWSEVAAQPDQIEMPDWHREVLDERDRAFREGSEPALDWEEAKAQIARAIR